MAVKKRKLDKELQKALIEYADTNCSLSEIARKYNIGRDGFTKLLKDLNIPLNIKPVYNLNHTESKYTKAFRDKDQEVLDYYKASGKTIEEVAKEKHICSKRLAKLIKENNIEINDTRKIYTLNENYFNNIGFNQAYWLGFIMGDGCITASEDTFKMTLAEEDVDHLKLLASELDWNGPLEYREASTFNGYNTQPQYCLCIHRVKFAKNLIDAGINPHKTCSEKFLNFDNDDLTIEFIRGLFDADGWCSTYNTSNGNLRFEWGICSSYDMCKSIFDFLSKKGITSHISKNNTKSDNELYRVRVSNIEDAYTLYNLLYWDNCISLKRKQKKLESLFI